MPPPKDGNQKLPFADLMRLEKINDVTYRSIALPFSPGGETPGAMDRAYGGHVYTQAAWAACHTVADGFLLHNVSGNFILAGLNRVPYVYKIHKIRDGRSYSTRIVNVTQAEGNGVTFTCTCSFKLAETSPLDVQEDLSPWQKYHSVLGDKSPEDFEEVPGMDVPWYLKVREETGRNDIFPGLEFTKVDMETYNADRHPLDKRQLMFYRPLGPIPSDPNLHLCAHIYASDRNSLYIVANHLDIGDIYTQMSSLVHSTIFHSPMKDLTFGPSGSQKSPMDDMSDKGRWFCKEDWTNRAAGGRAMFYSNVWAPDGTHAATFMQDGLIRVTKKPEATLDEFYIIRDRQARWKAREKL